MSGGVITEPHWRAAVTAAGMNLMEVYVAWMEVFFQFLQDPAGALEKPEVGKLIKAAKAPITKMIMVLLGTHAMTIIALPSLILDFLGIRKRKKARALRCAEMEKSVKWIGMVSRIGQGVELMEKKPSGKDKEAAAAAAAAKMKAAVALSSTASLKAKVRRGKLTLA